MIRYTVNLFIIFFTTLGFKKMKLGLHKMECGGWIEVSQPEEWSCSVVKCYSINVEEVQLLVQTVRALLVREVQYPVAECFAQAEC